jgi:hypothetical protein
VLVQRVPVIAVILNESWTIERHGYRTPAQARADLVGPDLMAV